jgi:S-adenosylmethionine synthetase
MDLVLTTSRDPVAADEPVEMVERKGLGHPDSLCDALAEEVSVALSRFYLERFGTILHHNVDKVLLVGGSSKPAFGAGEVTTPIEIYLAGRATFEARGVSIPVEELAVESCRAWLRANLRYLDPERHVRIQCRIRPGSAELVELFLRHERHAAWLANDTSCGTGFAPWTPLEALVLRLERELRAPAALQAHPERGEDIKVMGVRHGDRVDVTVADAFVGRAVHSLAEYASMREALRRDVLACAGAAAGVAVNAGDDLERGAIYLTVTGTSAEAGDDGEAGRGNRANGLITPYRPMSMESVAGKNPVSHVGKIYNIAAMRIANALVQQCRGLRSVECKLVSRIGDAVRTPQLVHLRCWLEPGLSASALQPDAAAIVANELAGLDRVYEDLLAHRVSIV